VADLVLAFHVWRTSVTSMMIGWPPFRMAMFRAHAGLFVSASCIVPLIAMVYTAVRAISEPIKFSFEWIPVAILIWAAMSAACLTTAACVAYVGRKLSPVTGRSGSLTFLAGFALGVGYALGKYVAAEWFMLGTAMLGPVLFRKEIAEIAGGD
jgi:hypothetical protein